MPKERKKRGRREEKRKRKDFQDQDEPSGKRARVSEDPPDVEVRLDDQDDNREITDQGSLPQTHGQPQFYGLLDDEEQSYFKRADQMLELDQFANPDERTLFLESLWQEVSGKELKIASSQSCSRLLERLIGLSSAKQLKTLFQKFEGHFMNLIQHRFASHCCEALFLHAAPTVTAELIAGPQEEKPTDESENPPPTMEVLFMNAVDELEPDIGYLMTDQFGSHTLRVLLLVLSGRPLGDSTTRSMLQSKNKEKITAGYQNNDAAADQLKHRAVPSSFTDSLSKVKASMIGRLETNTLRTLATQRLVSPVLRLLMEIELAKRTKLEDSLLHKLIPDIPLTSESSSVTFVRGLLYDPIGSHMLETVVQHAPSRVFKSIYGTVFQSNLKTIARNDIASFVLIKAIERLGAADLQMAVDSIAPEVPRLLEQSRLSLVKCLLDRCRARRTSCNPILSQMSDHYGPPGQDFLPQMLRLAPIDQGAESSLDTKDPGASQSTSRTHSSLLAQTLLALDGSPRDMITESLLVTEPSALLNLVKDRSATHIVQAALVRNNAPQSFRRRFIPRFLGLVLPMTIDPVASHVIDALWTATSDLHFLRDKIAEEMASAEPEIKSSFSGKVVWRNWDMDLYRRRKTAWIAKTKAAEEEQNTTSHQAPRTKDQNSKGKTGIELARERFINGSRKQPSSVAQRKKRLAVASG